MIPELEWSSKYAACRSCGTTRRPHRGRGFCGPCLYAEDKIKLAQQWDRSNPATLKGIGASGFRDEQGRPIGLITDGLDDQAFERFRNAWIDEYRWRLDDLKTRERHRSGEGVDGLGVEYHLQHLMRLIKGKYDVLPPARATQLTQQFDQAGLVALYRIIDDLVDAIPWKAEWSRIWEKTLATPS